MTAVCAQAGWRLVLPSMAMCTDNANRHVQSILHEPESCVFIALDRPFQTRGSGQSHDSGIAPTTAAAEPLEGQQEPREPRKCLTRGTGEPYARYFGDTHLVLVARPLKSIKRVKQVRAVVDGEDNGRKRAPIRARPVPNEHLHIARA